MKTLAESGEATKAGARGALWTEFGSRCLTRRCEPKDGRGVER